MAIIEQDVFDIVNEKIFLDEDCNTMNIEGIATAETTTSEIGVITTFANLQSRLCFQLFGEQFITCTTFEDMIQSVQSH